MSCFIFEQVACSELTFLVHPQISLPQAASALSATLQVESESLFQHPEFEEYGTPQAAGVAAGPFGNSWDEWSLLSFPDSTLYPEATQLKFVFEGSEDDDLSCHLDGQDFDCTSPYTTPHLEPGEHVFRLSPTSNQSDPVCRKKQESNVLFAPANRTKAFWTNGHELKH